MANDQGGGIYVSLGKIDIDNCEFSDNDAEYGGGLFVQETELKMKNSKLNSNHAGSSGGASYHHNSKNSEITGSSFKDNEAIYDGGAIFMYYNSDLKFVKCEFISNSASYEGGALRLYGDVEVTIEDSVFKENEASYGSCFALKYDSELHSENTEFSSNVADHGLIGSTMGDTNQKVTLVNSEIAYNKGRISSEVVYEEYPAVSKVMID